MNWFVFLLNRLHERYLAVLYNNKNPSYEELLERDGPVSINNRNLQIPDTWSEIFQKGGNK